MNKQQLTTILTNMNYKNGSYIKLGYEKDITTKKGANLSYKITKYTTMTVRLGINYTHTQFAKARFSQRDENAPVKETWYSRTDCKYLVAHKTNGKEYLQAFVSPNKSYTTYCINGTVASKEEYMELAQLGYASKPSQSTSEMCVMTIQLDGVRRLGDYSILY